MEDASLKSKRERRRLKYESQISEQPLNGNDEQTDSPLEIIRARYEPRDDHAGNDAQQDVGARRRNRLKKHLHVFPGTRRRR